MRLTKIALTASLIAGASFANANDIEFGIQGGYSNGGDALGTLLDTGDGISIGTFAVKQLTESGLGIKAAVNYMQKNGSLNSTFTRFPIDVLAVKKIDKLQLAAGLTYHLSPSVDFDQTNDGIKTKTTADVDNALGLVLEANYNLYDAFNLGLRYTNIEYSFEGITQKYDGSNVAITAGYTF